MNIKLHNDLDEASATLRYTETLRQEEQQQCMKLLHKYTKEISEDGDVSFGD